MSPTTRSLAALNLTSLRVLLAHIGSPTSGTKPLLIARLQRALKGAIIPFSDSRGNLTARVLSIDMGIRNLAYCVADVRVPKGKNKDWSLDVLDWKRVNVLADKESNGSGEDDSDSDAYSPARLSPAAVSLVKDTFLPTKPDIIAIERQRFRSGGGKGVLEWTLRVNMLEGMLWSAFNSIPSNSVLVGISPARVARFWVPKVADGKATVEKKQKVEVARRWLNGHGPKGLSICIAENVNEVKSMVLKGPIQGTGKVDDLADCLLQVGALVSWEKNRRMILDMDGQDLVEYCTKVSSNINSDA
jgi:cruciform cutting endonuclease 1